ncbi:type IV pilus secretin PilQ, partial [Thermodesulfobacteriota bacterium]
HNLLRMIADVSGFNVITSDDVKGQVSIHLSNVPWDQALDVILNIKDLGMVQRGNIILVVPQAKIAASEERKKSKIKALKEEKLDEIKRKQKDLEDLKPVELKVIPINYAKAADLSAQVQPILSEKGSISVDERTNVLIVKDIAENIEEIEEMIAQLDGVTPQVLIEARIVEANTNFSRRFGIQWGSGYNAGPQYGNPTGYNFPNSYSANGGMGGPNNNYFVDLPANGANGAVDFSFGHIANTMTLDMRLSAMESSGEGKIISSPRVVTLDNTQAIIQQGTAIPYESTSDEGSETEFVDANLSLTVTPQITADGSIRLQIKASKNAPNLSIVANGQPAIDKKEAQTEVLIKDGETTVIGGIFVVDESEAESGIPFFSKLPFIGWMFKTEEKIKSRNELLIFITPRIIHHGEKVSL